MSIKRLEELSLILNDYHSEFRSLFEAIPDPVCVANSHYQFELVNPAFTHVLGWPRDVLEGANYLTLIHPEDVDRTKAEADGLHEKSTQGFRNRYRHRDGHYVILEWNSTAYNILGKVYAVARVIGEDDGT